MPLLAPDCRTEKEAADALRAGQDTRDGIHQGVDNVLAEY